MNLATFRDAIVDYFDSTFSELNVSSHGGELDLQSVLRYAKADPALVVSITQAETDKSQGDGVRFTVRVSAVVSARSRAGEPKDERALRIGSYVLREVAAFPAQTWDITSVDVQAPRNIRGVNLFSTEIDKHQLALFGISWEQLVDITADTAEEYDDYETFFAEYNLGPVPDGEVEAEDTVDLTGVDIIAKDADVVAGEREKDVVE